MNKNYLDIIRSSKPAQFGILLIVFLFLYHLVPHNEGNYLWRLPSLLGFIPIKLNDFIYAALYEWFPLKVYDPIFEMYEEKAAFREFTKSISQGLLFLITFVRELLLGGDKIIDIFVSDAWLKENDWMSWPALPWTAATVGAFLLFVINIGTSGLEDFPFTNPTVPLAIVFGAFITMITLGTLIGLIPAERAVSIKPIEALREE